MIKTFIIYIATIIVLLSYNKSNYKIFSGKSSNRIAEIYLRKGNKNIDSLKIKDYYNNAELQKFQNNQWLCKFNNSGGSGVVFKNQILLSPFKDKLTKNLYIELYYKEGVLGDKSFKKNFIRKTEVSLYGKKIRLKRTCLKNNVEYYSKIEELEFNKSLHIYFNRKFMFQKSSYYGIKIDSSEYIFYKKQWFEFDNKAHKLFAEM